MMPSRYWRRSRRLMGGAGVLLILFLGMLGSSEGAKRGVWMTRGFQVLNLEPAPAPIVARFLALDGTVAYTITDAIPPGEARFYVPAEMVPPLSETFTGTLSVDSPGQVALAILHLEPPLEGGENEVFAGIADERLGYRAFAPANGCVLLLVHNLSPTATAGLQLEAFAADGSPAGSVLRFIPPQGTLPILPVFALGLPADFVGSAMLQANQRIKVSVLSFCDGLSAFVAPFQGSRLLLAPNIHAHIPGVVTPTLTIRNTGAISAQVDIFYRMGGTETLVLPPMGTAMVEPPVSFFAYLPFVARRHGGGNIPLIASGGGARPDVFSNAGVVSATQPVVALVRTVYRREDEQGVQVYRLFAPDEATPAVALPILFNGYDGWETAGRTWVRNLGGEATEVAIRYTTVPTGTVFWDSASVGPDEVVQVTMPHLPAQLASAILLADQPIVAVTGAFNSRAIGLKDRHIRYPGTNFDFSCQRVTTADFSWSPPSPEAGLPVRFDAAVGGTPPVLVTWSFGDGTGATGAAVTHTYGLAGTYDVRMTATNCLGFGAATAHQQITVSTALASSFNDYSGLTGVGPLPACLPAQCKDCMGQIGNLVTGGIGAALADLAGARHGAVAAGPEGAGGVVLQGEVRCTGVRLGFAPPGHRSYPAGAG